MIKKLQFINKSIYFYISVFLLIAFSISLLILFNNKYNKKEEVKRNSTKENLAFNNNSEAQNVDILIYEDRFDSNTKSFKVNTEYNFRIIKLNNKNCNSFENIQGKYDIDIPNTANQFPLRFPDKGKFQFRCKGQDFTLDVNVE